MSVGYTDSNYLRPFGAKAYGFVPIALTGEDMEGFHGHNEKLSVENVHTGTKKLFLSVLEVSAKPLTVTLWYIESIDGIVHQRSNQIMASPRDITKADKEQSKTDLCRLGNHDAV